jgi:hypothetical protein
MSLYSDYNKKVERAAEKYYVDQDEAGSSQYLKALQKAVYGDAGAQYGQGLGDITNYLAKSGPLADGGAGTALRYKLASQVYGGANRNIQNSYAEYLRQMYQKRQDYNYQKMLMDLEKNKHSQGKAGRAAGGVAGAAAGYFVGGPSGAAAGYGAGSGGGGWNNSAGESYYG